MNTLALLAFYYPPEATSGAARPARFAKYLPEFGVKPVAVTRQEASVAAPGHIRLSSKALRLFQRALLPFNENLPWLPYGIHKGTELYGEDPSLCVFSTSPPIVTQLAALVLKRRFGVRWIADMRDPMANNPFRKSRRASAYLKWLEASVMKHADVVIANTDGLKQMLGSAYPEHAGKLVTIWNGYDPAKPLAAAALEPKPYRVISHVGTLYGARHPGALLRSLERLFAAGRLNPPSVRVRLAGPIEEMQVRMDEPPFSSLQTAGCLEIDPQTIPTSAAHRIMAESDYLLLLDLNESHFSVQVPAKIFEYVQIGRPILCFTSRNSPTERILSRSGIPHRCVHVTDSAEATDAAVCEFFSLPTHPVPPSAWFLETFDARRQTELLASLCAFAPTSPPVEALNER
jgi:hypothetical protein